MNDVPAESMIEPSKVIKQYIKLRDAAEKIQSNANEQMKPYYEAMRTLETWMGAYLSKNNINSIASEHGTAYRSTVTSTKVTDQTMFMEFVQHGNWELARLTAEKRAVRLYMDEHQGQMPPGVEVTSLINTTFRRP